MKRRTVLKVAAGTVVGKTLVRAASVSGAATSANAGIVVGHDEGGRAGLAILESGGNAVDAAVAAALVAAVVAVPMCGIGGYGGSMLIALPSGKTTAIDFNSQAPVAARAEMFKADAKGAVGGNVNFHGWLAAAVPGTLAGLQLALDRYGTKSFSEVVKPALRYASEGFAVPASLANALRASKAMVRDEGSRRLFYPNGEPIRIGTIFRNPDLAKLLQSLAEQNSVESFYRGEIARTIAASFRKHSGLVTVDDLAAYRAIEVEPLSLDWRGVTIRTPPPTAGGLTVLEALAVWRELGGDEMDPGDPKTTHAQLETMRLAWNDRLKSLGDPACIDVPIARLLSKGHAAELATQVKNAVSSAKPANAQSDGLTVGGTIHLSAADRQGCMVALTLTHGGAFGAQVTVDGLGLLLGHGMSRFDPRPDRANSIGPRKRPLHNMCPTVVLRDGRPSIALGGRGGRKIPNAVFQTLLELAGRDRTLAEAVAAPECHTEGGLDVTFEPKWPAGDREYLRKLGYAVKTGPSAVVHAVQFDRESSTTSSAWR